ncbi:MAG: RIP metalloprotease RseP, partial [Lachnospiraceae bacterium]|nr:RIP metalloprotease RseP [Lachnospiraceae bacterium]
FLFSLIVLGVAGFDRPVITGVREGFPAEEQGLAEGDVITKLNGKRIHFYREVSSYTFFHAGETLDVTYERDGQEYTCTIEPEYDEESGSYLMGIYGTYARTRGTVLETLQYSVYEIRYWINTTIDSLRMLVTGGVGFNELSGPVGIVKNIGDNYDASKEAGVLSVVLTMLNYSIMLSANLGVMNLLPIPALDGGRLVFLLVEAVRRKKIPPEKEGMVHFVGLVLLLLLMVAVMFNDIRKLVMGG